MRGLFHLVSCSEHALSDDVAEALSAVARYCIEENFALATFRLKNEMAGSVSTDYSIVTCDDVTGMLFEAEIKHPQHITVCFIFQSEDGIELSMLRSEQAEEEWGKKYELSRGSDAVQ